MAHMHDSGNIDLIDQWSDQRTGWARLSPCGKFRYRLGRSLDTDRPLVLSPGGVLCFGAPFAQASRIVFLLLNPSDADASEPDPTLHECCKRARGLGAGILEIVNLFALRTPHPTDLRRPPGNLNRGDDSTNNHEILEACRGATMVIAGWGNDGDLDGRDRFVRNLLRLSNIELHHLGTTNDGHPKHPLARGRHRIPADQQPTLWDA